MIEKMINRYSTRAFSEKPISQDHWEKLITVINNVPTSINGQCFSVIMVEDSELRKKYSQLNWNQKHIIQAPIFAIFLADFSRVNYSAQKENFNVDSWSDSFEGFTVGVIDATIAATSMANAANLLNLGVCFIGGVRMYTEEIIRDFQLPKHVFPVVGLLVGHEKETFVSEIKPKVNKVYHQEYSSKNIEKELENYEIKMKEYYNNRKAKDLETRVSNGFFKNTTKIINIMITKDLYKNYFHSLQKQEFCKNLKIIIKK